MKTLLIAGALSLLPLAGFAQTAKEIVLAGYDAVFINPNPEAIPTYFSEDYKQHNPNFPDGLEPLYGFASNPPPGVKVQIGNVIADEDQGLVALHVRVEGFTEVPLIAIDIFRVKDGMIVQHWDAMWEEVEETASGNPMWTKAGE